MLFEGTVLQRHVLHVNDARGALDDCSHTATFAFKVQHAVTQCMLHLHLRMHSLIEISIEESWPRLDYSRQRYR